MEFKVTSGYIIVSDPCYKDFDRRNKIFKCLNGEWEWIGGGYERHKRTHDNFSNKLTFITSDEELTKYYGECSLKSCKVSVDSGMLAMCDLLLYRKDDNIKDEELWERYKIESPGDKFYSKLCEINRKKGQFCVDDVYVVSGMGDGRYKVEYTEHPRDGVISFRMIY